MEMVVKDSLPKAPGKSGLQTLSDADIVSQPSVSRRSLLAGLGLGAGAALAVSVGAMTPSEAADKAASKKAPKRKPAKKPAPKKESDSD